MFRISPRYFEPPRDTRLADFARILMPLRDPALHGPDVNPWRKSSHESSHQTILGWHGDTLEIVSLQEKKLRFCSPSPPHYFHRIWPSWVFSLSYDIENFCSVLHENARKGKKCYEQLIKNFCIEWRFRIYCETFRFLTAVNLKFRWFWVQKKKTNATQTPTFLVS